MNVLRRARLSRLLLTFALVLVLGAGATAVAASLDSGTPPPPKPLAGAVHDALAAAPVAGVTARIKLTDHLVDIASLQSQSGDGGAISNPLLAGASGRVWISAAGKVRVELQSESGDTQVLYDGQRISFYDSASNTLYRMQLPPDSEAASTEHSRTAHEHQVPTVAEIQRTITKIMGHATLSGATPGVVAGQPAYTVRISPSHDGGLFGGAELAWDAIHGAPLRLALYATSSTAPVLELTATEISYGPVADSVFDFSTPPGVTVHDIKAPASQDSSHHAGSDSTKAQHAVEPAADPATVQAGLPFPLRAPATLAGMPRSEVRSIVLDGHPSALITYGKGLAGVAVIESQAKSGEQPSPSSSSGAQLPSLSIKGSTATELPTALGTILSFERAGVGYTVLGSVTPAVAEAAARGL